MIIPQQNSVLFLLAALAAIVSGCDNAPTTNDSAGEPDDSDEVVFVDGAEEVELPPEMIAEIERLAAKQAAALEGAEVNVHRVFELKEDAQLHRGSKRVAVDVEFSGYGDLDLDDIEIVDARSDTALSYSGDIRPLKEDGSFQQNRAAWDAQGDRFRVLLVYLVPETVDLIDLDYWEQRLTDKPHKVGEGELKYDDANLLAGLKFWKWPASYHTSGVWQHGRWLIAGLGDDAAVVDLAAWPPEIQHWECGLLSDIEPAAEGGWIVITRTGSTREDIKFIVWHHPAETPGASRPEQAVASPGDHLRGTAVLGDAIFTFEERQLYRFVPGNDEVDSELVPVDEVPRAEGHKNILDSDEYCHARVRLGNGQRILLWDGDGYQWGDGQLQHTWPLGIPESYYGFVTAPAAGDAFYFLQSSNLWLARRGEQPQRVMTAFDNIMSVHPGPEGSLLFSLGDNDAGYTGGIWFPSEDTYIPFLPAEIDPKLEPHYLDSLHWSEETECCYLLAWSGVYTFPADSLLSRQRIKLPDAAAEEEAEVKAADTE